MILTDPELERWLTLYWMAQAGQDPLLQELWRLSRPSTVDEVTTGVARLCARHDLLRSLFAIGPTGHPVRSAVPMDDFVAPISFIDADSPIPTPDVGGAVSSGRLLWHMVFPIRDGLVHEVHLYLHHIVADAVGIEVWRTQLDQAIEDPLRTAGADPKSTDKRSGKTGPTSSANQRRDARLAQAGQAVVPVIRSGEPHPHLRVSTTVPDMAAELRGVSQAAGVSVAIAAKFSVAWAMAQLSGRPDVLLANVAYTGSLKREEINSRVANLYELVTVDDEATFHTALKNLQAESFNTYLAWEEREYSYEIDRRAAMLQKRGIGGIAPVYFDYIATGAQADASGERAAPEQSITEVGVNAVNCLSPVFIFFQTDDRDVRLEILACEEIIDAGLATILPGVLSGVTRLARQGSSPVSTAESLFPADHRHHSDVRLAGGRWVCATDIERLLSQPPGVVHARVEVAGDRVRAELVLDEPTSVFDVHEFTSDHIASHRTLCTPDTYLWRRPGDSAWQEWTATRETLPQLTCETPNEQILIAAIKEFHHDSFSNLAETYVQAGGRLVLAPAVTERLTELGLTGLGREHFEAPYSLRSLAGRLRPLSR